MWIVLLIYLITNFRWANAFYSPTYQSPHELASQDISRDINQRRDYISGVIFETDIDFFEAIPLYLYSNRSFNESLLIEAAKDLGDNLNPDFTLNVFIRILFYSDKFNDLLLKEIATIPLWITNGETNLLYWTENHHILFTCVAYLLRQSFSEHFPEDYFDKGLDERLDWILRVKQKYSLFEFSSPIYMRLSLLGLINLYDFAEDQIIKEEAKKCILKIVSDWMEHTNSVGVSAVSSGRTNQMFYYREGDMFGSSHQQLVYLMTGLGRFDISSLNTISDTTTAFILSDIDVSEAIASYSPKERFAIRTIGGSEEELFFPLKGHDRTVIELSMGSYSNYNYIINFYSLFAENQMLDHYILRGEEGRLLKMLQYNWLRRFVSFLASTLTSGSLLIVPEMAIYKDEAVMLTSCENYYPGFKGYQQMPGMAVVQDTTVFTYAMKESHFNNRLEGTTQTGNNNHMPLLRQIENIQVALYNPNLDMDIFAVKGREVIFYMNYSHYDQIESDQKWIFGRVNTSFVAVYRHCVSNVENHIYTKCASKMQAWITIVGTEQKYDTFDLFKAKIKKSTVAVSEYRQCISLVGNIDGKKFDEVFCRNLGNTFYVVLMFGLLLLFLIVLFFSYVNRKRNEHLKNKDPLEILNI